MDIEREMEKAERRKDKVEVLEGRPRGTSSQEWAFGKTGENEGEVVDFLTRMLDSLDGIDVKARLLAQRMYSRLSPGELDALRDNSSMPLYRRKQMFQSLYVNMMADPEFISPLVAQALADPMGAVKTGGAILGAKDDRPSDNIAARDQDHFKNLILLTDRQSPEDWLATAKQVRHNGPQREIQPLTMEGFNGPESTKP